MQVDSISSSSRWPRRIHEYRVQRVASRQRGQLIDAGIVELIADEAQCPDAHPMPKEATLSKALSISLSASSI
jgi:hypothetical protein